MQRIAYIDRRLHSRRDYPSAAVLAADYSAESGDHFSSRTIKRDIEWMRDQNAPIEYDPQRHGYFYVDERFQLPALMLTEGDLLAIMVADRALSSYRNSPFYERLRDVFNRLASLLPARISVHTSELAANVSVIAEPVTEIDAAVWSALQQALERDTSIRIDYQAPGYSASASRVVDPYHVVGHRGEWYLLAWSHHDQSVRIYALARIKRCRLTAQRFLRPADFRPQDYIDPGFGIFVEEEPVEVAVRFDQTVASRICERVWHASQRIEQCEDGTIVLRFATNQQTQTLFWVSQWGPAAEIVQPAELRARAGAWFRRTAARYRRKPAEA